MNAPVPLARLSHTTFMVFAAILWVCKTMVDAVTLARVYYAHVYYSISHNCAVGMRAAGSAAQDL